jgi:hypothetical protein
MELDAKEPRLPIKAYIRVKKSRVSVPGEITENFFPSSHNLLYHIVAAPTTACDERLHAGDTSWYSKHSSLKRPEPDLPPMVDRRLALPSAMSLTTGTTCSLL